MVQNKMKNKIFEQNKYNNDNKKNAIKIKFLNFIQNAYVISDLLGT